MSTKEGPGRRGTVSTCGMEPVFWTVKENGALPGAELSIFGAVYDTERPQGCLGRGGDFAAERADVDVLFSCNWAMSRSDAGPDQADREAARDREALRVYA